VDFNLTLIGQTIAMIVFVWFCMRFIWPFLLEMIEERQAMIADGLAAAEKGKRSLEEADAQIARLVGEARSQAQQIIEQANSRAGMIMEEARSKALQEKTRILESAQDEIEQERNRVRNELRSEVAAIAIAGAEKILTREIDAAAHREMLDKLAARI